VEMIASVSTHLYHELMTAGWLQVEMFAVTANETGCESDEALSDLLDIQQHLFEQLGLHFRLIATFDLNSLCLNCAVIVKK